LTGVRYDPIVYDGKVTNVGFFESFIYLILAAIFLFGVFVSLFFIKYESITKYMKIGIYFCLVAMTILAAALIYCDFYALSNDLKWGESAIIWFLASVPATVIFVIGLSVFFYNAYKVARENRIMS
jgi:hypothetical protein